MKERKGFGALVSSNIKPEITEVEKSESPKVEKSELPESQNSKSPDIEKSKSLDTQKKKMGRPRNDVKKVQGTVYFEPDIYTRLNIVKVYSRQDVSDIINDLLRERLPELEKKYNIPTGRL